MNRLALPWLVVLVLCACAGTQPAVPAAAQTARPLPPAALFERGLALARAGDAVRAEQYLLLAQRAGYPAERVIVPLVQVCIAVSRLRTALAHAQPFLRLHPDAWQLRYLTAAIHLALEQPADAVVELQRVLAAQPDAAQAHYLLGVTLRDGFRDLESARRSFETYLRLSPHGTHAPELVAWLYEHPAMTATAAAQPPEPGSVP